jgi:hypothetical protein
MFVITAAPTENFLHRPGERLPAERRPRGEHGGQRAQHDGDVGTAADARPVRPQEGLDGGAPHLDARQQVAAELVVLGHQQVPQAWAFTLAEA